MLQSIADRTSKFIENPAEQSSKLGRNLLSQAKDLGRVAKSKTTGFTSKADPSVQRWTDDVTSERKAVIAPLHDERTYAKELAKVFSPPPPGTPAHLTGANRFSALQHQRIETMKALPPEAHGAFLDNAKAVHADSQQLIGPLLAGPSASVTAAGHDAYVFNDRKTSLPVDHGNRYNAAIHYHNNAENAIAHYERGIATQPKPGTGAQAGYGAPGMHPYGQHPAYAPLGAGPSAATTAPLVAQPGVLHLNPEITPASTRPGTPATGHSVAVTHASNDPLPAARPAA